MDQLFPSPRVIKELEFFSSTHCDEQREDLWFLLAKIVTFILTEATRLCQT